MAGDRPRVVGARARRIEDPALLRGQGRYVDDVALPGQLHAAIVRSSHAHAQLRGIDASAARAMPGVAAAYTAADFERVLASLRLPIAFPEGQLPEHVMPYVLAPSEVLYVGEAIAMVVAESRALAEDAADAVVVDYAPLAAVVDARSVLDPATPKSRLETDSNRYKTLRFGYGDVAAAFARAAHVFREELHAHRGLANSIEGRGVVASLDAMTGTMTVWSSTQMSHELARTVADMLGLAEDRVRVIAPEVGGGFGAKYLVYPEEIAVAAAAKLLARPVKWIEDRREHFVSAIHERDMFWSLEIAVDAQAKILGVRGRMIHDQGAYAPHSYNVPYNSATTLMGPYVVPSYDLEVVLAQTNKPPVIPVRGAGYPQSNFAMERLVDRVARELALDRAEVRRRNLIPADAMPYETPLKNRAGTPIVYDSGDYLGAQEQALAAAGYAGFAARQAEARRAGRHIGIGIAQAVKGTGRGPFESATVRVAGSGRVSIYTGALAMGQGIKTALAQVCADELGVPLESIDVVAGDTSAVSLGLGGYASRQAITAGSSTLLAAREVKRRAIKVAAHMLEAAEDDLVITAGRVHVDGVPELAVPLGRIATQLRGLPGYSFPPGVEPGLESTQTWRVDALAYANGFHVCEVEVDVETGGVRILRYVAVQDCGKLINPLVCDGQIHGSVVHGIGNALYEVMGYDAAGQPITTTLADYLLPGAAEMPNVELAWRETPSPLNPLGIKGVAEAGIVCVAAAVAAAVEDALAPFGVVVREAPLTPVRVAELIHMAGD
jgi:aerobic carbon-monoxide dehydrogenase large subunit